MDLAGTDRLQGPVLCHAFNEPAHCLSRTLLGASLSSTISYSCALAPISFYSLVIHQNARIETEDCTTAGSGTVQQAQPRADRLIIGGRP